MFVPVVLQDVRVATLAATLEDKPALVPGISWGGRGGNLKSQPPALPPEEVWPGMLAGLTPQWSFIIYLVFLILTYLLFGSSLRT